MPLSDRLEADVARSRGHPPATHPPSAHARGSHRPLLVAAYDSPAAPTPEPDTTHLREFGFIGVGCDIVRPGAPDGDHLNEVEASSTTAPLYPRGATLAEAGAERDTSVVALIGYLWPGRLDAPDQHGACDLPASVCATCREIGGRIENR